MAVEIPVVIDIDKAFQDAANRVSSAIKPMKAAIEDSTANLKLKVGTDQWGTPIRESLKKILTDLQKGKNGFIGMRYSVDELALALDDASNRLNRMTDLERQGVNVSLTKKRDLQEAIVLLTQEIEQRTHSSQIIQRQTQELIAARRAEEDRLFIIGQEAKTISELTTRLSALRGKLDNLPLQGQSAEWTKTGREIQKATAELAKFQAKYTEATTKKGSINRISAEMQALTEKWNSMSQAMKFDKDGKLKASAQKIIEQYRQLTVQAEQYGKTLQSYVKSSTTELQKQQGLLTRLAAQFGYYFSIYSAIRFVKQIRDVTGELEYQRVALGRLLQDVSKGNALFERIKQAAVESPFRIKDLVTYTKQLAAYRIEQEELFYTTKRLADISAGLGVDMNRLILAYGQVRAAAVLRGQELRQFTEAGIPLVELLADKFTDLRGEMVSTGDVFKLISQRAVPFSMIADIFEDLTEKGGMFYKMQEEQAKTLKGRWEKLKDAYDIALQSIGDTESFQRANDAVIGGLRFIADNLRIMVKVADAAVISWAAYNAVMLIAGKRTKIVATEEQAAAIATSMRSKTLSGIVVKIMGQAAAEKALSTATAQATLGTNMLTRALGRLKVALLTNPWAIAGAAILGVVLSLTRFKKAADDASEATRTLNNAVEDLRQANKQNERISKLIKQYEDLSKVSERNAAQNETLERTVKKLSAAFPELSDKIENNNLPLKDRLKLVKDLNEQEEKRLKDIIREKEETLKANETKLQYDEEESEIKHEAYKNATAYYNALQNRLEQLTAQGQKGRGWFGKFLIGGNEYDETYDALVLYRKELDKTEKDYNTSKEGVDGLKDSIAALRKELYGTAEESKETEKAWKKSLEDMQYASNGAQLFTPEQLEGWHRLYDVSTELEKEWKKLKVDLEGLKAAMPQEGDADYLVWLADVLDAESKIAGYEKIRDKHNFKWGKQTSGGSSKTDPFITLMQERIKFMKDFQKGYEDLTKYMTSAQAKQEEAGIMLGRGQSLGLDAEEQMRAVYDLTNWYQEMIDKVQDQLRAKGIKGATPTDFLSIDTTKKSKAIQDLQKLLQSLWDAKTDYDTSQKKRDIEDALKRLSEEIKQTEIARNFYRDILDLTGDEDLAATMSVSIYGGVGDDFRDRMQQQLDMAMRSIDGTELTNELREAFENQDFGTILQNLDKFPEEWRKRVQEMASDSQKFEADRAKDLLKALQRAKTYADQQVELAKQTAKRTADIQSLHVDDDVRKQMLKDNARKEAEESAKIAYEAFKDTPMYVELFSDLDQASMRMLTNMRENLEKMKDNWKNLHPRELKELQSRLNELDEQIALRNPFKALANSIKEYYEMQKNRKRVDVEEAAIAANEKLMNEEALLEKYRQEYMATSAIEGVSKVLVDLMKKRMEDQAKVVEESKKAADDAQQEANQYKRMADLIDKAADKMQEWAGYVSGSLDGIQEIVGTFASDDFSETFGIIAEGLGKTVSGTAQLGKGIAELMTANPQGLVDTFQGLGNVISGTFGSAKQLSIKKLNKKIQDQQDILDGLTYSYDRLEKAMAKAFGSDYIYNYNEQLKNLQAQQAAYEEQLRLEQNKGKKKDKDKIKDYQDSIQEVEDQIMDMSGGLSEFFTGTDVKSAAEEFANSWIEAYKSFSSTTGAMRERFQDMIGNMITQSLAGQMMQRLLQPIFDEIDRLSEDGELTASEIGSISDMAIAAIPQIDNAMTGLVNNLAGAGINLRQQAGQFTGISRDIAGASEESILGLAAAVNTANYYISHVPTISENVAAIREYLTGESAGGRRNSAATRGEAEGPTYEDQMLIYASAIPTMRDDMAVMRSLLERVIKPVGVSATHYVAVR